MLGCLAFGASPALASRGEAVFFEAPRDLLSASKRAGALNQLQSLGVHALRVELIWKNVAPAPNARRPPRGFDATNPSNYFWRQYDLLLAAAHRRGWTVLLTATGPVPRWATAGARDHVTRPDQLAFKQFMTAVGSHYGDQVQLYSIWNEPNHPQFLDPQYIKGKPASPRIYRGLFQAGVAGLKASGNRAAASAPVLFGETAPVGTRRDVAPLAFLRGALCLNKSYHRASTCSRLSIGGYAHHAYSTNQGPFYRPPRDDVTIGVLGRLTQALSLAERAGAIPRGTPIYLTEFGVQSKPNPFLGVPVAKQAEFDAISERIASSNPRVAAFSQFLLRDDPQISRPGAGVLGGHVGFQSGLRYANGRAKPVYNGFRTPLTVTRRGGGVSLWGLVRPAQGPTTVTVQAANGRGRFRKLLTARTNARGYWAAHSSYRGGRRWRVRWRSPGGAVFVGPPIRAY